MVKGFNVFKYKLLFFILDLLEFDLLRGMYLKLKTYFRSKNFHVPELVPNYIPF